MNMKEIRVKRINFVSFVKFNFLTFFSSGVVIGFIFFIISMLGGNVTSEINGITYDGMTAGIIAIFLAPLD